MKYISGKIDARKSAISLCIALALQGNTVWAETINNVNNSHSISCPEDIKSLTKAQKAKLPATCLKEEPSFLEESWEWVAGGVAAVAAAVGIVVSDDDDSNSSHNSSDNPLPPDDGSDTPTPPDDGSDTPTPPDDGSDTPTPPAPPAPGTASFTNGVEWNEASSTLTIKNVVWTYSKNADGTYVLTDPATGNTALLSKWTKNADGSLSLSGQSADGSQNWLYNNTGKLTRTDAANWHEGDGQQINTNGGEASGTGNAGQVISGDGNNAEVNGDTSAREGGTGTSVAGDGNTIDNKGKATVDGEGSTGTDVTGNNNSINNNGDSSAATAINDTTGVININAENGQAFYSDGNANNRIINLGAINLGADVPATADNSAALVTPELANGTIVEAPLTLDKNTVIMSGSTVTNRSVMTATGKGALGVDGTFNNESGAVTSAPVTVSAGGVVNNSGTLSGTTTVNGGTLNNDSTGTVANSLTVSGAGKVVNAGTVNKGVKLSASGKVTNSGTVVLGSSTDAKNASILELNNSSVFENAAGGQVTGDNNKNAVHLNHDGTLKNDKGATMTFTASSNPAAVNIWNNTADFINDGTANATGVSLVASAGNAAAGKAFFWNQDDGVVNFTATASGQSAVSLTHDNFAGINDGTINISGNGAVAMKGGKNAQLVNNGTINLGTEGTTESGMIAMQLDANATAAAVIENNGAINIYAKDSYAFSRLGANGRVINNGTVNLEGEGSGLVKEAGITPEGNGTGGNGTETHAATYTLPVDPTAPVQSSGLRSGVSQYTVGTTAGGTAGRRLQPVLRSEPCHAAG